MSEQNISEDFILEDYRWNESDNDILDILGLAEENAPFSSNMPCDNHSNIPAADNQSPSRELHDTYGREHEAEASFIINPADLLPQSTGEYDSEGIRQARDKPLFPNGNDQEAKPPRKQVQLPEKVTGLENEEFVPYQDEGAFYQAKYNRFLAIIDAANRCPGFPHSNVQRLALVRQIIDAIKNTADISDIANPNDSIPNVEKKRAPPGVIAAQDDKYSDRQVVDAAWDILYNTAASQYGLNIICKCPPVGTKYKYYESFEERFADILDGLRSCKAVCKGIFSEDAINVFAVNPERVIKQKRQNQILNDRRNTEVKYGKQVLKQQQKVVVGKEEVVVDASGNEIPGLRRKLRKSKPFTFEAGDQQPPRIQSLNTARNPISSHPASSAPQAAASIHSLSNELEQHNQQYGHQIQYGNRQQYVNQNHGGPQNSSLKRQYDIHSGSSYHLSQQPGTSSSGVIRTGKKNNVAEDIRSHPYNPNLQQRRIHENNTAVSEAAFSRATKRVPFARENDAAEDMDAEGELEEDPRQSQNDKAFTNNFRPLDDGGDGRPKYHGF